MPFEAGIDIRKNLLELESGCFDNASYDDYVAMLARRLGSKPLRKYNSADLYAAIRHNVGLSCLIPLAIGRLDKDPFVVAGEHPADLLVAVLESDTRFWIERHDLWLVMVDVLERALTRMNEAATMAHRAANSDESEGAWLPGYLGDDFMGALLHFRGIHSE